jgi:hypothetical protein
MDNKMNIFGSDNKKKCNLLLCIIPVLSILFIIFSMIVVEKIKPLGELLFFKQFIIFSLLFLIILPTLMIIIGNIYFKIINKKIWFSWLKIPECYDDIFTIIAIFPLMYLITEIGIFFAFYTKLFELNEILLIIIFGIIGGLLFVSTQIIIRKIYRLI